MDQESFRKLLQTPRAGSSTSTGVGSRGSLLAAAASSSKAKTKPAAKAGESAFKPRKVKAADAKYRDRAAERRIGAGNEFTEVEELLETFEKRTAAEEDQDKVEEQRQYLGGDETHSVLVKGLDFALLEQTRARVAAVDEAQDEEELERAFAAVAGGDVVGDDSSPGHAPAPATSASTAPKKSRADLLKSLKQTRQGGSGAGTEKEGRVGTAPIVDDVKATGKFKPIGFKPIGAEEKTKKKKVKAKDGGDGERKKKRRKVDNGAGALGAAADAGDAAKADPSADTDAADAGANATRPAATAATPPLRAHAPATSGPTRTVDLVRTGGPSSGGGTSPPADDFDIFAGAGDYEGIDLGESSDEDSGAGTAPRAGQRAKDGDGSEVAAQAPTGDEARRRRGWFDDPDPEPEPKPDAVGAGVSAAGAIAPGEAGDVGSDALVPAGAPVDKGADDEAVPVVRLVPLASSAVPSIRDILAMDEAVEKEEKRKARKEKRKK